RGVGGGCGGQAESSDQNGNASGHGVSLSYWATFRFCDVAPPSVLVTRTDALASPRRNSGSNCSPASISLTAASEYSPAGSPLMTYRPPVEGRVGVIRRAPL